MLPRVIILNATSIDGCLDAFAADLGVCYGLVTEHEDAALAGAGTVLRWSSR